LTSDQRSLRHGLNSGLIGRRLGCYRRYASHMRRRLEVQYKQVPEKPISLSP
jgi:hypothetical protein